jgi:ribonuclease E
VVPLVATTAVDVALYILNQKRLHLNDIQQRYRVPITVTADEDMHISQYVIERGAEGAVIDGESAVVHMDWAHHREDTHRDEPHREDTRREESRTAGEPEGEQSRRRSRRRRRKRHGETGAEDRRPSTVEAAEISEFEDEAPTAESAAKESVEPSAETSAQQRKPSRRRGRRGGRRGRSGQRPERAEGEVETPRAAEAKEPSRKKEKESETLSPEHEERQNGKSRESKPHREEELVGEAAVRDAPKARSIFDDIVSVREETAEAPAPKAEGEGEPAAPRRRGWWSRGS